jgi:hypothetical protein
MKQLGEKGEECLSFAEQRPREITECQIDIANPISEDLPEGDKAFMSTHTQIGHV